MKLHTLDSVKKGASGIGGAAPPKPPSGNTLFTGGGMNVIGRGDDDDDEDADVFEKNRGKGKAEGSSNAIIVRLYKNGFVVSTQEGVLRDPALPENQKFMKSINDGFVPDEIMAARPRGAPEVDLDLEDHRSEVFVPPPYIAFGGAGSSLRSGGAAAGALGVGAVVRPGAAAAAAPAVDPSLPVTTLQVRLLDGRRERLQFNLRQTVADLQARVLSLAGSGGRPFVLAAGFPPAVLGDPAATIEAAGLKGASVTQQAAT